jgi:hypothetical protein
MSDARHPISRPTLVGVALCLTTAAVSSACSVHPVESPAVTPMSDAARAELAPNGRLRAGLNYSNVLLVSTRTPEHTGVAPDLARELARRANATVEFVGYENAGLAADAATDHAWDVAFIGAEPARAREITFTPAYVEIEATYLVPAGTPIRALEDVDADGVRIATPARAAYTLYLQRTLRHDARRGRRDTGSVRPLHPVAPRRAGGPEAAPPGPPPESTGRACARRALYRGAAVDGSSPPTRRRSGVLDGVCQRDHKVGAAAHDHRAARGSRPDDRRIADAVARNLTHPEIQSLVSAQAR